MMPATQPLEVFYSYSHKDEDLREKLETSLSTLKRQGVINGWHDRQIMGGENWEQQIDQHLESAQIILLLISPDFVASDYCYNVEMERALQRHQRKAAKVIPILLRPADWETALFGKLQCLPKNRKPVTEWSNQDKAFLEITKEIRKIAESWQSSTFLPPSTDTEQPPPFHPRRPWFTIALLLLVVLSLLGVFAYYHWSSPQCKIAEQITTAQTFMDSGHYDKAATVFQQVLQCDADNAEAQWGLTLAKLDSEHDPVLVEQQLRQLYQQAPNDPYLNTLRGNWHAARHETDQALPYYQTAIKIRPTLAEAHFGLGVLYDQQGNWEVAERSYRAAIEQSPVTPKYSDNLAYLYTQHQRYPEALAIYRKLPETFILAHHDIATIYRLQGKPEEALGHQRRAEQLLEDDAMANLDENQAPWYFEIGDDAIELHTRQEKQAYLYYSLALNFHLLNQTDAAGQHLEKARQLAIDHTPIKEVIAADLRRLAAARPEWEELINGYRDRLNRRLR